MVDQDLIEEEARFVKPSTNEFYLISKPLGQIVPVVNGTPVHEWIHPNQPFKWLDPDDQQQRPRCLICPTMTKFNGDQRVCTALCPSLAQFKRHIMAMERNPLGGRWMIWSDVEQDLIDHLVNHPFELRWPTDLGWARGPAVPLEVFEVQAAGSRWMSVPTRRGNQRFTVCDELCTKKARRNRLFV